MPGLLLDGFYHSPNYGDKLIEQVLTDALSAAGYAVLDDRVNTEPMHTAGVVAASSDQQVAALIMGGGGYLTRPRRTSLRPFHERYKSLKYGRRVGIPAAFWGVGGDRSILHPAIRPIFRRALGMAQYVWSRDEETFEIVEQVIGRNGPTVRLAADASFLLPTNPITSDLDESSVPRVVLHLELPKSDMSLVQACLKELSDWLKAEGDQSKVVILFDHQAHHLKLARAWSGQHPTQVEVVANRNWHTLFEILVNSTHVISPKLHVPMTALQGDAVVYSFSTHDKVLRMMRAIGRSHACRDPSSDTIIRPFLHSITDGERLESSARFWVELQRERAKSSLDALTDWLKRSCPAVSGED